MGFLEPANLIYAASLAALVLIYLRARSRPTIDVASLLLFDEVPAPVAKSRVLRLDRLFWLEVIALAALTLAIAGLYIRSWRPAGSHRRRALVFDLGAGMGATTDGVTRLDQARKAAAAIVAAAPPDEQFSIISYAIEASSPLPMTNDKADVQKALEALHPLDVAARPAALRAALIRARSAGDIELYSDSPPPSGVIEGAQLPVQVKFNQVGQPVANLAIVSLDPGTPRAFQGRCLLRNFSPHSQECELKIDEDGHEVFHSTLIIEPSAEMVVPFGPVPAGGLLHARIVTPDALAADNERYAIAPSIAPAYAIVLSPEPSVRDDLARLVLAINRSFIVTAAGPNQLSGPNLKRNYDLAILHDAGNEEIQAAARLYIFPEPQFAGLPPTSPVPVTGTVALAEMEEREGAGSLSAPVILGPSRVLELPGWMTPMAAGAGAGDPALFPLAAIGSNRGDEIGVVAFDIRNHLLLDPDRTDALILTIDMLRQLAAPRNWQVANTGNYVDVATAGGNARLIAPDGSVQTLAADEWGRVRFRPLMAGRYRIVSGNQETGVFANYYDARESDLSTAGGAAAAPSQPVVTAARSGLEVRPFALPLIVLALFALLAESMVLARRASRWGASHV
ncbi:MAG: VWA domain-containing protein [Candidatus Binataceae bacterium]|jgi:hypothetical protein